MTERYHIDANLEKPGQSAFLDDEESHHFLRVMRGRPGDTIEIFGHGHRFSAEVLEAKKNQPVEITLLQKLPTPEPMPITICCVIPWIRGGKSETLVQKLTELGIQHIILFHSKRETAHGGEAKLSRLRRIAIEACKQCGRNELPIIHESENLKLALETIVAPSDSRLILYENERTLNLTTALKKIPLNPTAPLLLASGPEGGFSPDEVAAVSEIATSVTLGPLILRAETAPLVAASATLALAGRF